MKKLLVTVTAVAMLIMSVAAVSAAEEGVDTVNSNMDAETFLETRLERLDEAIANGVITQEQYDTMVAHITENAEVGVFGKGPNGYMNNEECVLGEEGNLQLFRNENSGLKNGQGNGVARRSEDGTGFDGGRGQGSRSR